MITVGIVVESIHPLIYGKIIDSITGADKEVLKLCLVLYLVTQLSAYAFGVLETYIGQLTVTSVENELKKDLFKKAVFFKCSVLDEFMEGELLNRLEFDVETIVDYYIDIVTNSISIICNFVISVYFILHISKSLSMFAVLMLPVLYLVNYISRNRIRILQEMRKQFEDKYFTFVSETLGHLRDLKLFRLEKSYMEKYAGFLDEKYEIEKKNVVFTGAVTMLRGGLGNIIDILIVYASAMIIFDGGMTVGSMVAFNTYLSKLFEAVNKILDINMNKHSMEVNYERVTELWEKETEKEEDTDQNKQRLTRIETLELSDICFGYGKENVLRKISFKIKEPGIYTIVGENGSGKSTLFRLVTGLYEGKSGEIYINKIPIKKYGVREIRRQTACLTKEPFLISGTIGENIRIGKMDASDVQIVEASKKAGLHEDVMGFEKGYDTEIGEYGNRLSSGQKQKIGLARMLLQRKSLILLDEATSALDSASRKKIDEVLEELKKDTIIINISHNEWEIENSENIFVLYRGSLAGQGTHEELIKSNAVYRQYFKKRKKREEE